MNTRMMATLGLSAFVLGGAMVGCTANGGHVAAASDRSGTLAAKSAAQDATRANKALAQRDGVTAIRYAESAVGFAPRNAAYRMVLGASYLQGGRFASARDAYGEALKLAPADGKAALNYALATIATGDWQSARAILADHAATIADRDRGLALALAGDAAGAVALLTQVARSPQGDAKVRQNLALAYALGGDWQAARVVAATDLSPADVDARLQQWATFAQPHAASDQVAALLGVKAMKDEGQPIALALNAPVQMAAATAVTSAPVAVAIAVPAAAPVAAAPKPIAVAQATPSPAWTKVTFGPRHEVVQSVPATLLLPTPGATRVAIAPARVTTPAKGDFVVQLGAFGNAGVAKDAWGRATRRFAGLAGHTPTGMTFTAKSGAFYRLSVDGFDRAGADALCRRYRISGGVCFVRRNDGDRMAQWLRKGPVQVASR